MLDDESVMRELHEHRQELRGLDVRRLSLFGSMARNEATEVSDRLASHPH